MIDVGKIELQRLDPFFLFCLGASSWLAEIEQVNRMHRIFQLTQLTYKDLERFSCTLSVAFVGICFRKMNGINNIRQLVRLMLN